MITKTKALIPNKCWLVETNGKKIGTLYKEIQGFSFYTGGRKIILDNTLTVNKDLVIELPADNPTPKKPEKLNFVHEYPTASTPFNGVYSIKEKLPLYTTAENSKSNLCAGYYLVYENNHWKKYFCPKFIKLHRCPYYGPFKTETEMNEKLCSLKNEAY